MYKKTFSGIAASIACITSIVGCSVTSIDEKTLRQIYAKPLPKTERALNIYHLGHSLVGRNMPAMLKQLSGEKHDYRSQLGWGSSLESHWEPELPINGFESENAHLYYQDVFEGIDSQRYDAFVLTESVEIKDAIKYHKSDKYLAKFADHIKRNSPNSRVYLYETWHEVTDKNGWIYRLQTDYKKYWLGEILDKALLLNGEQIPVYVIPAGQVMAALFEDLATKGGVEGLSEPKDIFGKNDDGSLDPIHLNDIGNYLVALVHYAVLYQKSPEGLPFKLKRADGVLADAPTKEIATLMQSVTWRIVSSDYRTGLVAY